MGDVGYPLVVYGPSGEPCDVKNEAEEAAKAALGYRRHFHMGGTFGLPEPDESGPAAPILVEPEAVPSPVSVPSDAGVSPAPASDPHPKKKTGRLVKRHKE